MWMMNILIYIQDNQVDEQGIEFAGMIARYTHAKATLHYTLPESTPRVDGEAILKKVQKSLSGIQTELSLSSGDPIESILTEIIEGEFDLVIVPACHGGWLKQSIPLCKAMLRESPASVLIVNQPKPDVKRILVCTGGLEKSDVVIETGARLAQKTKAGVTLLHVVGSVPSMYTGLDTIEETLPELLQTDTPIARHLRHGAEILERYGVVAELGIRHGVAVEEIIREASIGDYDMIVIGTSGVSTGLKEWFMGNVTQNVVDLTEISVLVVNSLKTM
jgi:nucleotide-binding universal stress UspA family protein